MRALPRDVSVRVRMQRCVLCVCVCVYVIWTGFSGHRRAAGGRSSRAGATDAFRDRFGVWGLGVLSPSLSRALSLPPSLPPSLSLSSPTPPFPLLSLFLFLALSLSLPLSLSLSNTQDIYVTHVGIYFTLQKWLSLQRRLLAKARTRGEIRSLCGVCVSPEGVYVCVLSVRVQVSVCLVSVCLKALSLFSWFLCVFMFSVFFSQCTCVFMFSSFSWHVCMESHVSE